MAAGLGDVAAFGFLMFASKDSWDHKHRLELLCSLRAQKAKQLTNHERCVKYTPKKYLQLVSKRHLSSKPQMRRCIVLWNVRYASAWYSGTSATWLTCHVCIIGR